METSLSFIRKSDHCNGQFSPLVRMTTKSVTTDWFVKIKKILQDSNFFQSLLIQLPNSMFKNCLEVVAEEDQLRGNVVTNPPYKLRELKLHGTRDWYRVESPLTALNGLFWICHPDVLSILTSLEEFSDETILLEILKCKVQCWKHPLKSIEFEGIDCSRLLSYPGYIDYRFSIEYRFRLSWFEV
ncbi:uncharacterized protein LOC141606216 [Silene latifolia]|uniref:uncharacterized protein LOC141606216 n=1 Tax=Silene latifolia TaxID=37657 RepID=UPI003D77D078